MAADASFLRLLNVHADQHEVVLEYLQRTDALDRVSAGVLDFDLMDKARTRSNLGNILGRD